MRLVQHAGCQSADPPSLPLLVDRRDALDHVDTNADTFVTVAAATATPNDAASSSGSDDSGAVTADVAASDTVTAAAT